MSNQIASLTKQDKALYVTLCLTCKQRLRPRVLFQGPPPTTTPTCKQTLRPRVLFQGPPPTTTPTCKQRLRPRVLFQGAPRTTTFLLLLNGSYKQRLEPRVLFLPCTASEITTTTTPTLTPPPAAALLLLPLLLLLVLLGCCFVCTPWPANKDCGPVVVVTGGGVSTTKGKKEKNKNIHVQGQDVKSGCKPHKTRQILVCYTGLQSLSLPTTTTTTTTTTTRRGFALLKCTVCMS